MKQFVKWGMLVGVLATLVSLTGCAYGGVSTVGKDGGYVVVTRNDGLLMGALRKIYVCKATTTGLSGCKEGEAP